MYKNIEIETSYRYLSKVITKLKEPICILGGWAVFFTVNNNYYKQTGRIYIGSRDIDLGFNDASSIKEASLVLEKELNFQFVSFRFYKSVNVETGTDLTEKEAKSLPRHMMFYIYVDPIMSYADDNLNKQLGFTPVDEPLLKTVFSNKKYGKYIKEFGKKLLLPTPEILLATKLNSVLNRDKDYKRQKDICDIVGLCLFSEIATDEIINQSKKFVSTKIIKKFGDTNFEDDIINCSKTLGLEVNTIKAIISRIKV